MQYATGEEAGPGDIVRNQTNTGPTTTRSRFGITKELNEEKQEVLVEFRIEHVRRSNAPDPASTAAFETHISEWVDANELNKLA